MTKFDSEVTRKVQKALDDFYTALDEAAPQDVRSPEWLAFIDDATGPQEGYAEWIAEVWEPIGYAPKVASAPAIFKS